MGADGWFVAITREKWDAEFPDVEPSDCGLYAHVVLGVECVYGYEGDNLDDYVTWGQWLDMGDPTPEQKERRKAACEWFSGNAERHMVWT